MKRDEAILIINEFLANCKMEEIYMCMVPPSGSTPIITLGYQIHIRSIQPFNEETQKCIDAITKKHQLSAQTIEEEEKMIIYRKR